MFGKYIMSQPIEIITTKISGQDFIEQTNIPTIPNVNHTLVFHANPLETADILFVTVNGIKTEFNIDVLNIFTNYKLDFIPETNSTTIRFEFALGMIESILF